MRTDPSEQAARRAEVQRRGNSFRKQVRDPVAPDRRLSLTGASRAEVEAKAEAIARLRRDVREGELSHREAANIVRRKVGGALRVEDLWTRYVQSLSESWGGQARTYWTHMISPAFGDALAWDVDETAIRSWELDVRRRGYSDTTIRNAYDCLAAAFRRAVRDGLLERMPWDADSARAYRPGRSTRKAREEEPDKREAARDWYECEALIRAASEIDAEHVAAGRFADLAYRIAVMLLCGLRQGEACALAWDRVEIDGGTASMRIDAQVRDQWRRDHPDWLRPMDPPKGRKSRTIALAPGALMALRLQRDNLRRHGLFEPHGPVFPRYVHEPGVGRWRTHAELIKPDVLRAVVARAGLPNVERWVTHSLRHSFSTIEVVLSGGDLRSVQKRTGHSDIRTLETYLHSASRGRLQGSFTPALSEGVLRRPGEIVAAAEPAPSPRLLVAGEESEAADPPELRREVAQVLDALAGHAVRTTEAVAVAEQRREARRERARAKARAHRRSALEPAIRAWLADGAPGTRPPAVTAWAERNYENAYKKALRAGEPIDRARVRGKAARKAVLAAFTKVLKRIQRGAAAEQAPLPAPDPHDDIPY